MILNNTQANIFKVNGGLADNFANRPTASGSFYIFYSIDTQEIYYDNGAWVLIGSGGGGGGVNIYNSDGTLTSNRQLNGANNDLTFNDVNNFRVQNGSLIQLSTILNSQIQIINNLENDSITLSTFNLSTGIGHNLKIDSNKIFTTRNNNDIGLKLDFANSVYQFGQITGNNTTYLQINDVAEILQTQSSNLNDGLNFDFANEIFKFGQIDSANGVHIKINGSAGIDTLQTIYNNNEQGLELQFNNQIYRFGHLFAGKQTQINIDDTLQAIILESSLNIPGEEIKFLINGGINAFIATQFQQNDIGLKLDFANSTYQLGQITGGNQIYILLDDVIEFFATYHNNNVQGFNLDFSARSFSFGDFQNNGTNLAIQDNSQFITTFNQGNTNGINLEFANTIYQIGQLTGGNTTYLTIDDAATYPVQIDGTNVLSNTSGSTSGQHLKIKINGVDYKIELKNP